MCGQPPGRHPLGRKVIQKVSFRSNQKGHLRVLQGQALLGQQAPFALSFLLPPGPRADSECLTVPRRQPVSRSWALPRGRDGHLRAFYRGSLTKWKDKQVKKKSWLVESAGKKIKREDVPENDEGWNI